MLRDPAHAPFVDTLETYLELAGDARATAEALSLHRATLYYRLNRIEEITGARLKTGDDRLALHLGLRLARLSGLR
jgi:DNA-binding PucR family transcriptional regulator